MLLGNNRSATPFIIFPRLSQILFMLLPVLISGILGSSALHAIEYVKGDFSADLYGSLESKAAIRFHQDTPKEYPSVRLRLKTRVDLEPYVSFYGELWTGFEGSALTPRNDGVFVRFDEVYPSKDWYIELSEAYLSLFLGDMDLRVGIQKFAWGTLDQFNPTDNLNPWDMRHLMSPEPLDMKVGVPAVRVLYESAASSLLLDLIWMPVLVPYRLPDPSDRWFPPIYHLFGTLDPSVLGIDFPLPPISVKQVNLEPDLPPRTFENSDFAIRISRTIKNTDLGLSYFNGYDRRPVFKADGTFFANIQLTPPGLDLSYLLPLEPVFHRMQVFGLDAAASWRSFTFRAEGAFFKDRYIMIGFDALNDLAGQFRFPELSELTLQPNQNGVTVSFPYAPEMAFRKNVLSFGGGVDYMWGSHVFLFQFSGDYILNYDGEPLIFEPFELMLILGFRSMFLEDTLSLQGAFVFNPMQELWMITTQASYAVTDTFTVGANLLLLDGKPYSYLGQYRHHDQIEFFVRYAF